MIAKVVFLFRLEIDRDVCFLCIAANSNRSGVPIRADFRAPRSAGRILIPDGACAGCVWTARRNSANRAAAKVVFLFRLEIDRDVCFLLVAAISNRSGVPIRSDFRALQGRARLKPLGMGRSPRRPHDKPVRAPRSVCPPRRTQDKRRHDEPLRAPQGESTGIRPVRPPRWAQGKRTQDKRPSGRSLSPGLGLRMPPGSGFRVLGGDGPSCGVRSYCLRR